MYVASSIAKPVISHTTSFHSILGLFSLQEEAFASYLWAWTPPRDSSSNKMWSSVMSIFWILILMSVLASLPTMHCIFTEAIPFHFPTLIWNFNPWEPRFSGNIFQNPRRNHRGLWSSAGGTPSFSLHCAVMFSLESGAPQVFPLWRIPVPWAPWNFRAMESSLWAYQWQRHF